MRLTFKPGESITNDRGEKLELHHYYQLSETHRFIIRSCDLSGALVEVKEGRRTVRRTKVLFLGQVAGRRTNGEPVLREPTIELDPADPSKDFYPITDLVERLLKLGIKSWKISVLCSAGLSDCTASHCSPHMVSDQGVRRGELPATNTLLTRSYFEVTGATWAVTYDGQDVHRVYLWMGAADVADTVVETIEQIRSGNITPSYTK